MDNGQFTQNQSRIEIRSVKSQITAPAQEKIHEELDCVLGEKSDVTEEDLKEMVYLEQVRVLPRWNYYITQVISEGLRYMVLPNTSRFCTEAYKIPDSEFTIPKGMKIIIPTVSLIVL